MTSFVFSISILTVLYTLLLIYLLSCDSWFVVLARLWFTLNHTMHKHSRITSTYFVYFLYYVHVGVFLSLHIVNVCNKF